MNRVRFEPKPKTSQFVRQGHFQLFNVAGERILEYNIRILVYKRVIVHKRSENIESNNPSQKLHHYSFNVEMNLTGLFINYKGLPKADNLYKRPQNHRKRTNGVNL